MYRGAEERPRGARHKIKNPERRLEERIDPKRDLGWSHATRIDNSETEKAVEYKRNESVVKLCRVCLQ